ncbi:MAG: SpoIIIAH-like family protein [Clostridia bacterium]|nr:SpoIIIAH-like family protein [Clostridia bacterium]MCI9247165.1 SpoIIIAH-like family protein [Clostridia bacterium]
MKNLNLKKNQVVIFVIALMLVTAGYLNFSNQQNLLPTSSLADSEQMAAIGDATLVSANQTTKNSVVDSVINNTTSNTVQNSNAQTNSNVETSGDIQANMNEQTNNQVAASQTNNIPQTDNSYYTQSKLDREKMYSQMLENYQKILEADNLSAEEKTTAQEEIKKINNEKNAIMIAENLIKTKGFEEVLLFVNNGNVSVVVRAEKLDESQIAQIQNIVTRELNVKVTKINVSVK